MNLFKNKKLILVAASVLAIGSILWLNRTFISDVQKPKSIATLQMPGEYIREKGTVLELENERLSINTETGIKRYSLASTSDIQGIVSGSIETNDTVTVETTTEDLKNGKEVILFIKKGTDEIRSIYIIK